MYLTSYIYKTPKRTNVGAEIVFRIASIFFDDDTLQVIAIGNDDNYLPDAANGIIRLLPHNAVVAYENYR
jgi:hypothetical protein